PRFANARSILWMLSLTAISGRPTRSVFASPPAASTSTSTRTASIPTSANVFSLASMGGPGGAAMVAFVLDLDFWRPEPDEPPDHDAAHRHDPQEGRRQKHVQWDDTRPDNPGAVAVVEPTVPHPVLGVQQRQHVDRDHNADAGEAEDRRNVVEQVVGAC